MSLTIDKQKAKRLYPTAPEWLKKDLDNEFGADSFNQAYWEDLLSFALCCQRVGTTEEKFNEDFGNYNKDSFLYEQKKLITRAINTRKDGTVWAPDWNKDDERKWYPWFRLASGSGFVSSVFIYVHSDTHLGSRLVFPSKDQSDFAGTTFESIYLDSLL
jgi:hypothetical protein